MKRSYYYSFIEEKLHVLSNRIKSRGKINLLDLNIHSEVFFANLFNLIFDYELINANVIKHNTEAIDLIDEKNKIIAQVSSTCTKNKIEKSLGKELIKRHSDYHFIFIAIAGDGGNLKSKSINNPNNIAFSPSDDIYDIDSILKILYVMEINSLRAVYELVRAELGDDVDMVKVDSNLASIINVLSKENLNNVVESPDIDSFQIEKKIKYNDLLSVKPTIDDYMVYCDRIQELYNEFDEQGANVSFSVLSSIRSQYVRLSKEISNPHDLFFEIIDSVIDFVQKSKNYSEIPFEELQLCVSILVVDAFIRCKIFEKPKE